PDALRASRGASAHREVRHAGSFASGIHRRAAASAVAVALGWLGEDAEGRLRTANGLERPICERDGVASAGASLLSRRAAKFVHRSGQTFAGSAKSVVVRALSGDALSQRRQRSGRGGFGFAVCAHGQHPTLSFYLSRPLWRGWKRGLARLGRAVAQTSVGSRRGKPASRADSLGRAFLQELR